MKCCRWAFFVPPETQIGHRRFLALQVERFLPTCNVTRPHLQRFARSPATFCLPTCNVPALHLQRPGHVHRCCLDAGVFMGWGDRLGLLVGWWGKQGGVNCEKSKILRIFIRKNLWVQKKLLPLQSRLKRTGFFNGSLTILKD